MDESVAAERVYNTEFKKLNPVEDVRQSSHKELTIDQIRDICSKKLTHAELKATCSEYGLRDVNGHSIEDLCSSSITYFENRSV